MTLTITPSGQACGASITGVDLTKPLSAQDTYDIRQAWLKNHVVAFPDQKLSSEDLERFTLAFGDFGEDPHFASIPGHSHICEIVRMPDEKAPIFASNWHTDWSFQENPPIGTCLYGIDIPKTGGDTLFSNQHKALDEMPKGLRKKIDGLMAIHSAEAVYAPDGYFSKDGEQEADRSMKIVLSEDARRKQLHPLIRDHSETGRPTIYSTAGYIEGFEGLSKVESDALLMELYQHQGQDQFIYRHKWEPNMLVMWDNRCLLHMATGGYEGQKRRLHRTTFVAHST